MLTVYVKNWLTRADEDLKLVEILLGEKEVYPNPICFHAQQAVEKYLKGFLARHDLHVRKIHDLEILLDDIKNIDQSFEELRESAVFLNQFYIESRYPDDYTEFSIEDAQRGYEAAKKIRDIVWSKIE
jgi:HEPN domain-containing protein